MSLFEEASADILRQLGYTTAGRPYTQRTLVAQRPCAAVSKSRRVLGSRAVTCGLATWTSCSQMGLLWRPFVVFRPGLQHTTWAPVCCIQARARKFRSQARHFMCLFLFLSLLDMQQCKVCPSASRFEASRAAAVSESQKRGGIPSLERMATLT